MLSCPKNGTHIPKTGTFVARRGDVITRATATRASVRERRRSIGADPSALERIAERALWIAVRMIHEANHVRPNDDGLKVGGHQASSASVASILTALYLHWLRPDDLVSVKPHASPIYHALLYLMGGLEPTYLTELRAYGGLQAYPSRTKDPDRVDFSTGSVGLGAVAPLFASLADRYLAHQGHQRTGRPDRRFVAIVGDAELDEGSVWEAAIEPALAGLGNTTIIVDANRQSLDRVVPGARIAQVKGLFESAGWNVLEVKYGRRLLARMLAPGGEALRRRIDEMSNEEYQVLIRRPGPDARTRCIDGAAAADRDALASSLAEVDDADVPSLLADLGGHDIESLLNVLETADADRSAPTVVIAYTIKGWRLPFAGDAMNHSAMLSAEQVHALASPLGADADAPWATFPDDSPEGRLCRARGEVLSLGRGKPKRARLLEADQVPRIEVSTAKQGSTQGAFGDALVALARVPKLSSRVVTASPDVTISTSLGSWVNRVGVFAPSEVPDYDDAPRLLKWAPSPVGQHIEFGISEMNLFLWLGQAGLSAELFKEPLIPIGTVYDPFVCRGLDALIYALYVGSRFIVVGTPAGITLAPEGGAHQSTITPSIGIELPGLRAYEPAFAAEVAWCLEEGIRGIDAPFDGFATYLRLSTRMVDQSLSEPVRERLGLQEWRRQMLAGGYRLIEATDALDLPSDAPAVTIVASGAVVTEAIAAVRELHYEEVAARLVVVTSAERLSTEVHQRRLAAVRDRRGGSLGHLEDLFPAAERRVPMVTVHDGSSHALSFLGSVFGTVVVPLGVDAFGQSGRIKDLYADSGIDADHIVDAALLAIESGSA